MERSLMQLRVVIVLLVNFGSDPTKKKYLNYISLNTILL